MRLLILTSNALRHKYISNRLSHVGSETMVISECKPSPCTMPRSIRDHFELRDEIEREFFLCDQTFLSPCLPIQYGELNEHSTIKSIGWFNPHLIVTFGCSIVRKEIISFVPQNKIINLHLGVAPHYRGSGTNFWPWVFNDLGNVGATLMFLDEGIDTGDIISVVKPEIKMLDDVHSLGCRAIVEAGKELARIIPKVYQGHIQGTPQAGSARTMRRADFIEESLVAYLDNLKNGIVKKYLEVK